MLTESSLVFAWCFSRATSLCLLDRTRLVELINSIDSNHRVAENRFGFLSRWLSPSLRLASFGSLRTRYHPARSPCPGFLGFFYVSVYFGCFILIWLLDSGLFYALAAARAPLVPIAWMPLFLSTWIHCFNFFFVIWVLDSFLGLRGLGCVVLFGLGSCCTSRRRFPGSDSLDLPYYLDSRCDWNFGYLPFRIARFVSDSRGDRSICCRTP